MPASDAADHVTLRLVGVDIAIPTPAGAAGAAVSAAAESWTSPASSATSDAPVRDTVTVAPGSAVVWSTSG